MAHDEDRNIGRRIIGAMMKELLSAVRAAVIHLEVGVKDLSLATGGAETSQPLAYGPPRVAGWGLMLGLRISI